jgi:hypothetical protein
MAKMNKSKVTLSLIALSIIVPTSAIANNVQVRTNNIQATTQSNGSIYVNTGKTAISIPARNTHNNSIWYPWRYWRTPWQSNNCRQSSYQQTTEVSNSGSQVVRHSSTSSYCR